MKNGEIKIDLRVTSEEMELIGKRFEPLITIGSEELRLKCDHIKEHCVIYLKEPHARVDCPRVKSCAVCHTKKHPTHQCDKSKVPNAPSKGKGALLSMAVDKENANRANQDANLADVSDLLGNKSSAGTPGGATASLVAGAAGASTAASVTSGGGAPDPANRS
ncbi:hypothetical protein CAOG_08365 [Capsaspora owczarzaki ATCC 30864]|uniref:Uncharacterized protein n=1 Tax=Capsaspora owczarzaki (strain ATCC 30864) TaxID=595528 RepID=A0A0D2WYC6_CAPO3|nr:hypothetical protein CAOG_08365 [Capsaspora owczarzaki ATCC 30864]KJE98435.1 hypothetical protein CAOG_008365 [Capsaspora owczarzaki ATCC 30864]|eukprot:XP_004340386.1 hypothetical protein CAOG_08365 [Capsaspora owczarzaki ATCC 30864]